jgi:hypothetical protein
MFADPFECPDQLACTPLIGSGVTGGSHLQVTNSERFLPRPVHVVGDFTHERRLNIA